MAQIIVLDDKVETKEQYLNFIKEQTAKVVVVDFYADWCGPCKMIAPKLSELTEKQGEVVVIKVNVDESEDVAQAMGITAMPTFHIYKNGDKVDELMGANFDKLKELVNKALA